MSAVTSSVTSQIERRFVAAVAAASPQVNAGQWIRRHVNACQFRVGIWCWSEKESIGSDLRFADTGRKKKGAWVAANVLFKSYINWNMYRIRIEEKKKLGERKRACNNFIISIYVRESWVPSPPAIRGQEARILSRIAARARCAIIDDMSERMARTPLALDTVARRAARVCRTYGARVDAVQVRRGDETP